VCEIFVTRELNVGSPFFRACPSHHIPKAMPDVNVLFFIHSFTFSGELIMDSGLTVPKKTVNYTSKLYELLELVCMYDTIIL